MDYTFDTNLEAVEELKEDLKKTLTGYSAAQVRKNMIFHYKKMRLLDAHGKWRAPELERISSELLPTDCEENVTKAFVDEVFSLVARNRFLVDMTSKLKRAKFPHLFAKIKKNAREVWPDVISYGITLERFTKAMRKDYHIICGSRDAWQKVRKEMMIWELGLFERAKLKSVEDPLINVFLDFKNSGNVLPSYGKNIVSVNILEAGVADFVAGNTGNTYCSYVLAKHRPCKVASHWSEDKNAVHIVYPLAKEWADLYTTWNLNFVTRYQEFPYFMLKLLIPQVLDYKDAPDEYIFNRVLALYIQLHHGIFGYFDRIRCKTPAIDWYSKEFSNWWGNLNKIYAKVYDAEVGLAIKN